MIFISDINFSWGRDFISNPDPITKELLKDSQVQLVYYNFNVKDSIAITPDKYGGSQILYILDGNMTLYTKDKETHLQQNDSILFSELKESSILTAQSPSKCLGISTSHTQHVASSNDLMAMIDIVEKKDVYTYGHSRRVCLYSNAIALEMNPCYDIITLGNAANLHDVGKINVPISILRKPGKLTNEEYDVIKEHSMDSYNLVQSFGKDVARAVREHHERLDGSGYPDGLQGEDICMDARIIAVADVFDAMTCKRVYNEPRSFEDTVAYLESCDGQYDQKVVAVLKQKVLDGTLERKEIACSFIL